MPLDPGHASTEPKRSRRENFHCSDSAHRGVTAAAGAHPDHSGVLPRLRRVQGQLAGIERMIQDRRYCVDLLTQLQAVASAINAIEGVVLERHLRNCFKDAISSPGAPGATAIAEEKMEEMMNLILKRIR